MSKTEKPGNKSETISIKTADESERRRSKRMEIVDSFSLFAVYLPKGPHRLKVYDISDAGIGFDIDIEEEGSSGFAVQQGQMLEIQLYLNQTLFLPLSVQIKRIVEKEGIRRLGAEFNNRATAGYIGLLAFLDMLDAISDAADIGDGGKPLGKK